jgi:hypothetical protein
MSHKLSNVHLVKCNASVLLCSKSTSACCLVGVVFYNAPGAWGISNDTPIKYG